MLTFLLHVVFVLFLTTQRTCARTRAVDPNSQLLIDNDQYEGPKKHVDDTENCSIDVDHDNFFDTLRKLEDDNKGSIAEFEKAVGSKRLDGALMQSILNSRGLSHQAIQQNLGRIDMIPAGIDLGGFCIIRMLESFLFFHRMKLRNSTNFKIQIVENDLKSLVVRTKLSLNDLHLQGTYERLMQDGKHSNLFYSPTQGMADIMLKDVEYKMEGRYRMLNERITIDIVVSTVKLTEAVIVTKSLSGKNETPPFRLRFDQIEDLLQRMKGDLDTWIKDCLNDRLVTYSLGNETINDNYLKYHLSKTAVDNNYLYYLIGVLHDRINKLYTEAVSLPDFTIFSVDGTIFRIRNGALRGLDSIYKKSVASSYLDGTLRHVCGEIGFSHLQVSYTYEAFPASTKDDNNPALTGTLILSAKDLTAILVAGVMIDPKSVELSFQGITQLGTESLTIEGAAVKELGKFRHIIQKHVMALMSYSINFHVRNLKTVTDCQPNVIPYHEPRAMQIEPVKLKKSMIKKKSHKNKAGPLAGVDWWINIYGDSEPGSDESRSRDRSSRDRSSHDRSHRDRSSRDRSRSKEDSSKEDRTTTKKRKTKSKKHKTTTQDSRESRERSNEDRSNEDTTTTKKHKKKTKKPKATTKDSRESREGSKENKSKEDKKTTKTDKTTTEKATITTEKDKTTTEKDKTTTEKDKTTTLNDKSSSGESHEIISQGLLLRNSRRNLNKSNYNKNGKNEKNQIARKLRRRFRPLRDSV